MKSKVLFTVTNIDLIDDLKKLGISNFVYPLSFFCVGIPSTFTIEQMQADNAFIYVNRVLDCEAIDRLKILLHNLPANIKGIIFDDLGLIEVLKDSNLIKILNNSHFNTNFSSINEYLKYVDDIIVSTDISEQEIDEIIAKTDNKLSFFTFGLVSSLYSRRTLLTNHAVHHNLPEQKRKALHINDKQFIGVENEYGTVVYHYPYFNALRLLNKDAKYFFYFPILLSDEQVLKCAQNNLDDIPWDYGFLDTKTIYRVKQRGEN